MKLSGWQEAQREIDNMMERYTTSSKEEVPFLLRWLSAQLMEIIGEKTKSLNQLNELYDDLSAQLATTSIESKQIRILHRRMRSILLVLVAKYCNTKQMSLALDLLDDYLKRYPFDAVAWSQAVRVMALVGDLNGARQLIIRANETLDSDRSDDSEVAGKTRKYFKDGKDCLIADEALVTLLENVDGSKKALWAGKDDSHSKHAESFSGVKHREIEQDVLRSALKTASGSSSVKALEMYSDIRKRKANICPGNGTPLNNEAIAHAYAGNVIGARRMLESSFREFPFEMMSEPFVLNAATLLEAAPPTVEGVSVAKSKLTAWVTSAAPDDFDLSCCKQPPRQSHLRNP